MSGYWRMGNDPDGGWGWLGAKIRQIDAWIAGQSPSRLMNNGSEWGFNTLDGQGAIIGHYTGGVSLGRQFLNGIPVVGRSLSSGDHLNNGNYMGAMVDFSTALAEGFTLGYGTLWNKSAQLAITNKSTPIVEEAAETGGKELFNFGTEAAKHMAEKGRAVPVRF